MTQTAPSLDYPAQIEMATPFVSVISFADPAEISPVVVGRMTELLSREEVARYHRMRHPVRKRQLLLGHVITRVHCSRITNRPVKDIAISFEGSGKPLFPPYFLSLTHDGDFILSALAACPVGIDVEVEKNHTYLDKIAERTLSTDEAAFFAKLGEAERKNYFTRYWTLKEAAYKANDVKWSEITRNTDFVFNNDGGVSCRHFRDWTFRQWSPASGVFAALAIGFPRCCVSFCEWSVNDLEEFIL